MIYAYHFSQTDSKDKVLESLAMSKNGVKKQGDVVMLRDGRVERMEANPDCNLGDIHCTPALGGGCCPAMFPVCCGNGECSNHGPCY